MPREQGETLRLRPRRAGLALTILGAVLLTGCAGRLELIALNYTAIDPPAARTWRIPVSAATWSAGADGTVWVTFRRAGSALLPKALRQKLDFSLRISALPAGPARNERADADTLRLRVEVGPFEGRFESRRGIIAVYRVSERRLRLTMRLMTSRRMEQLLGGWGKPADYLLFGTFEAERVDVVPRDVIERTEDQGFERAPGDGS